jgi:hypothetical protein
MSITDIDDPILHIPYKESEDPRRANVLTEKLEPTCPKSRKLREDPKRTIPKTDTVEPNLLYERSESEEPRYTTSKHEHERPKRFRP